MGSLISACEGVSRWCVERKPPARYTRRSLFRDLDLNGVRPMTGMTMTEKILAKHAGKRHVSPEENVWVNVDVLMTHDVCGPGTIGIFHEKFGRNAKVWDGERVVIIPDH